MNEQGIAAQDSPSSAGVLHFLWQRKLWWLLPLIV
jgi:hypothetical protein